MINDNSNSTAILWEIQRKIEHSSKYSIFNNKNNSTAIQQYMNNDNFLHD